MQLNPHHIHIWSASLIMTPEEEEIRLALLSNEEYKRAERFHFSIHRSRFIAARAILRRILSKYVDLPPETLGFAYTEHHKPYLASPTTSLQFNLAHSNDLAVYALTLDYSVGIDIEKIRSKNHTAIAKRFFSSDENKTIDQSSEAEKINQFYLLWSRKEALIKAVGKGLSLPLSSFTVAAKDISEELILEKQCWSLMPLKIADGYYAALASNQKIAQLTYLKYTE